MATETADIIENWDHPINLTEGDAFYDLLLVLSRENRRISLDIEELYDDRFLSTATGTELEKLGNFVGVKRKNGESDDKLRKRIEGEFLAQASDATYETLGHIVLQILETTKEAVTIDTPPTTPSKVVKVTVDGSVIEDSILNSTELANLFDKAVSADAKVNLIQDATFAFAGDDPALEGWDEGTWSEIVE